MVRPSVGAGMPSRAIGPRRQVTAADLAILAGAAIYIGPLDTPEFRSEVMSLGARDDESARVRLAQIAAAALSWGVDGNPHKYPPDENAKGAAQWNARQVGVVEAVVAYWTSFATAPKRDNVRLFNRDLLEWAVEMVAYPLCDARYEGFSMDEVYDRNRDGDDDWWCSARAQEYRARFERAIRAWAAHENLYVERDMWPTDWPKKIPSVGHVHEQASLVNFLRPALLDVAVDKMVVWPGGPVANPTDNGATVAAIVVAAIVAAAAGGVV